VEITLEQVQRKCGIKSKTLWLQRQQMQRIRATTPSDWFNTLTGGLANDYLEQAFSDAREIYQSE